VLGYVVRRYLLMLTAFRLLELTACLQCAR